MTPTAHFHIVLHRSFDMDEIAEAADNDRGPRHVLYDLSKTLPARIHFSGGPGAVTLLDRILGLGLLGAEAWAQARQVLAETQPGDVVLVNDNAGLALGLLNAARRRRLNVWEVITWPDKKLVKIMGRLVKLSGGITRWSSNTPDKTEALQRVLGLQSSQTTTVPEEVDASFFRPADSVIPSDPPLVFAAGREGRDYALLAAAVEGLGVETVVCAVSPSNPDPRTMTVPAVPSASFTFEPLNWPDFRDAYHRARVVAVPLLERDGSPGLSVIIEAMACRRPVIATIVPGYVSRLIEAGVILGVPVGDTAGWRAAIQRVLNDPTAYDEMAERGYQYVLEHHTTAAFMTTMTDGMRQLAAGATTR